MWLSRRQWYSQLKEWLYSYRHLNIPFFFPFAAEASIETITIQTGQISVCGHEGIVGWDSANLEVIASTRPEKLSAKLLVTALLVATGSSEDRRHVLLQPLMMGYVWCRRPPTPWSTSILFNPVRISATFHLLCFLGSSRIYA